MGWVTATLRPEQLPASFVRQMLAHSLLAPRSDTALMNASYTLQAPHVTSQQSFWRFALQDLKEELGRAYGARKVAGGCNKCVPLSGLVFGCYQHRVVAGLFCCPLVPTLLLSTLRGL